MLKNLISKWGKKNSMETEAVKVEKDLEDMIYQNCLAFALFERKWNREQREKKRQEQKKP